MAQSETSWIAWLAGTVGTIILGALGWLAVQAYEMRGGLSEMKGEMRGGLSEVKGGVALVSGEVKSTSDRVERIAKALPEMGRYIAAEDVSAPITAVVISTSATKGHQVHGKVMWWS